MAPEHSLRFEILHGGPFVIVRLPADMAIPDWAIAGRFHSITRTSDELSIVCPAANVPSHVDRSQNWACLKLTGPFPFSLTGVLLSFIEPLSRNGVPIFAISTFDTDYVLVPEDRHQDALELLQDAGHILTGADEHK